MLKMRGCILAMAVAAVAAAAVWTAQPIGAERAAAPVMQEEDKHEHHRGGMSREEFEAYRLKRLQEMAAYFGIPTEGKSARQLKQELIAAKEADKEKWEAFKAERQAKRLDHLREIARDHGIQTEGKTAEQLHEELMKAHGGKDKRRWKETRELKRENSGEQAAPSTTPSPSKEKLS